MNQLLNNALLVLLLEKVGPTFSATETDIRRAMGRNVRIEPARTSNGYCITLLTEDPMVLARLARADVAETAALLSSDPRDPNLRAALDAHTQALGRLLASFTPEQLRTYVEVGSRPPSEAEIAKDTETAAALKRKRLGLIDTINGFDDASENGVED